MKKIIAWLLVLALTAAISIGATLAYLTDTDEDVNVMTLGKVKIDQLEYERIDDETQNEDAKVQEFQNDKPLYPAITDKDAFDWETGESYVDWEQIGKEDYTTGIWNPDEINNELDKMVFVKNKGDYDAYVRSVFAFEANGYTLEQFKELFHLNINETDWTWEWEATPVVLADENGDPANFILATATYNKVLKPGELTEISLSQIALDPSVNNADLAGFGDVYQINVISQAIQADGFDGPADALNEGFGKISATNYPFETYQPMEGIDLKTALHYYEGDKSNQITGKVTNVVFDLKRNYPDVVKNYEGTLVTDEQDRNVFAYYVPNGTNYDVYFLANGTIYTPKDSTELFRNMTALQSVDTSNLDVSRTEIMFRMFQSCGKLTEIDVSDWDTSSATTMSRMFQACTILPYLDVSDWNTSNVTDMYCLFGGSENLNGLDVSKWDVSSVTNMEYTFWHCYSLENLDVADWDVGNVTSFTDMFAGKHNLGNMKVVPAVENWDMSSAVSIRDMFYGCAQIEHLDLSKWDVSNVKDMHHTFCDCFGLKSVNFSGWNTPNLENMDGTFNDCYSLETLDMSMFNTSKVGTMAQLFEGCAKLKSIQGMENWDTSSLWQANEMFFPNGRGSSIEVVDLSSFNTSKLVDTWRMFSGCSKLKTVYVGDGWDLSNATSHWDMFGGCYSLVGANGTTVASMNGSTDKTYACVDTPAVLDEDGNVITEAVPGYLTYKAPVSTTP